MAFPIALVGVGKIARDQHIPAIAADPDFELVAAVSRNATVEGVPNWTDFGAFLADGPDCPVALCAPPGPRTEQAMKALAVGRDVLLEKPPAATLGEIEAVAAAARASGATLFATWHSRFAPAVDGARQWLAGRPIRKVRIVWREDVRHWHPGQDWIWEPGGFGVFDPGINALSILSALLPDPVTVTDAELEVPANRAQPIAARLTMSSAGIPVTADFDWRQEGPQTWDITVETDAGRLDLREGGAVMSVDGTEVSREPEREYPLIYRRFAELLSARQSDVDTQPLRIVADAFLRGRTVSTDAFED